uniref:LysM domain-containing protein n=1 Tax=Ditylenchus dipsaci TaxID=166011 RepID=A0A915D9E9_9BILA
MEHHHVDDEYTFLCGYQKIRRYGSTSDLNSQFHPPKYSRIVVHQVEPSDTLQSLELKYNSSMYEIKRINRLWSNDSLYCKSHVNIPVFDELDMSSPSSKSQRSRSELSKTTCSFDDSQSSSLRRGVPTRRLDQNGKSSSKLIPISNSKTSLSKVEEAESESLDQIFKRIDKNVKKSQKIVRKLNKNCPDI